MKHQGEIGFTYDSKAEEWAAWCSNVWEHDRPRTDGLRCRHVAMASDYTYEAMQDARRATEIEWSGYADTYPENAAPSPAQPQNTAETGQPTGRGTIALLCLQVGVIAGAITFIALFIF